MCYQSDPVQRHLDRVHRLTTAPRLPRPSACTADLVIIGCCKTKLAGDDRVPAAQLYTSKLFAKRRAYAIATGRPWLILSAKHGLVHPEQRIPPYDTELGDLSDSQRDRLAKVVADRLSACVEDGAAVELHAGADYAALLTDNLYITQDLTVELPMRGKQIGQQLAEYKRALAELPGRAATTQTTPRLNRPAIPGAIAIVATRLYCRRMAEFTNCEAVAWAAVNDRAGTVQYANLYNGRLTPTYKAAAYTFPMTPRTQRKLDQGWQEVDVTEWPAVFTIGGARKVRAR